MLKAIILLLAIVVVSCNNTKYLYIVRHAEKLDNTPYSVLSPEGHQRAQVLKEKLLNKKIDMIFATPFKRTQETAQPLADALHKTLFLYRNNAVDSIVTVANNFQKKNMLMVGHSGNIPGIVEGVTGKKVKAIGEAEYDNLYIIKTKKGKRELIQEKY